MPLAAWDFGFELRRGHGCLSLVSVVCCSGGSLCDGPILRLGDSSRVCVIECDKGQQLTFTPTGGLGFDDMVV
jgi:hypothetical protein